MKRLSKKRSRNCEEDNREIEDPEFMIDLLQGPGMNDDLRIIYILGDLCSEMAIEVHNATLKLLNESIDEPIIYHINSHGGDLVGAGLPLVETIRMARELVDVYTYCQGVAYSAAALLLASGDVDYRFMSPLSQVMIHDVQTNFGWMDSSTELPRNLKLIDTYREMYLDTFAFEIGKYKKDDTYVAPRKRALEDIKKEIVDSFKDGDTYFSAKEAKEVGIVDKVNHLIPRLKSLDEYEEEEEEEDDDE